MKLAKMTIISGCQTGVDQAGLFAAFDAGFATSGFVTRNNRTLNGDRPDLIQKFNLIELPDNNYKARTWKNVECSDGTLRIAYDFGSRGEKCTLNAINRYKKPRLDLNENDMLIGVNYDKLINWIKENNIGILNIAGNSEETSPGIYNNAYKILYEFFLRLKQYETKPAN